MAGNKEIEVEDFATIAQTNNILGSSIGGGGGGSEYVTKIQAVSGGAREDLLTSYSSMEFIPITKVQKSINNIEVLNNFLSARAVYCRIGIVADPDDERIPFIYAASDFKYITFGVVVNGTMVTKSISLSGSTGYWYNIGTTALSGNYLFCHTGSSNNANTQYRIYKLDTSNNTLTAIAAYTGSNFKYPRSFSFVEKVGNYHYAYFDVSGTYRYICRLYVNEIDDSYSYTKGLDASPMMYSQVLTKDPNGNYSTCAIAEDNQVYIRISSTWDYHSSQKLSLSLSYTPMTPYFVRCLLYQGYKCINVPHSPTATNYPNLCEIYTGTTVKQFVTDGIQPELINYRGNIWWTELNSSGNTYKKLT
jgi:hypothetical protein